MCLTHLPTYLQCIYVCVYVYVYICVCVYIYMYMYIYIYTAKTILQCPEGTRVSCACTHCLLIYM